MVRLEGVLEGGVGQEPRDDLGLALGDHDSEAACVGIAGGRLGADLDHVQLGEDRLHSDLASCCHGGDHGDVVAGLDVIRHALLLAGRDGQGYVAPGNRQVLGLRAERLGGLGHVVGGHHLAHQDGHERHHSHDVWNLGEVDLRVVRRHRDRPRRQVGLGDRDPGLQVGVRHHDRLSGTDPRLAGVESYEDEGHDHDEGQQHAEQGEWPARGNCAKRPQGRPIIGKICRCRAPLT